MRMARRERRRAPAKDALSPSPGPGFVVVDRRDRAIEILDRFGRAEGRVRPPANAGAPEGERLIESLAQGGGRAGGRIIQGSHELFHSGFWRSSFCPACALRRLARTR